MTKIKLADGTIINASNVALIKGTLNITTTDLSVEELAKLFEDKNKTSFITLLTESEKETGYKTGFTSFAGIRYNPDGSKVVELFQPKDMTEARISSAEGTAYMANKAAENATTKATELEEQNAVITETLDSLMTELIPSLLE